MNNLIFHLDYWRIDKQFNCDNMQKYLLDFKLNEIKLTFAISLDKYANVILNKVRILQIIISVLTMFYIMLKYF